MRFSRVANEVADVAKSFNSKDFVIMDVAGNIEATSTVSTQYALSMRYQLA
jgi:hypothetical protein